MNDKFIDMLAESVLEEKKKDTDEAKDEKSKGKRGRPKKDPNDNDAGEGIRDITLIATIKIDGKTETKEKKLSDIKTDDIDDEKKKFERQVNKEYDYEADVSVKVKIGNYDASADAEDHMTNPDKDNSETDDYED